MLSQKKILIVDDNKKNSQNISKIVNTLVKDYDLVNTSENCLNYLQNKYYDFVILNLHVKGELNGKFILRWLERRRYFTNVIAFSYYPKESTWVSNILSKWSIIYLESPINLLELKNKIKLINKKLEYKKMKKKKK